MVQSCHSDVPGTLSRLVGDAREKPCSPEGRRLDSELNGLGLMGGTMTRSVRKIMRLAILGGIVATMAACGGIGSGDSGLFGRRTSEPTATTAQKRAAAAAQATPEYGTDRNGRKLRKPRSTFFDLFKNNADPNVTVEVNKYLWQASLEVLNFLPIQSVDPFSGVIVTGYGTPPGGGRAYRATIYVQDPALDARSLKVALVSKSGPVDAATVRAVEDAILTRARQLRIRDGKL